MPSGSCLDRRRAGLLLHLPSLPGPSATGDLGHEAHRFVEFLAECGFSVWQMLPVGPTHGDGSPYQAISAHAGDSRFISLQFLADWGWLGPRGLGSADAAGTPARREVLIRAHNGYRDYASREEREAFAEFVRTHGDWLGDYSLFQALREEQQAAWWDWPAGLRDRKPRALAQARARLATTVAQVQFEQFVFFRQWGMLRTHAAANGIQLFGDMPIFVAHDSAEVWAHRDNFYLDASGHPTVVAGVPPDYFSATGQRWGNPLYRWDVVQAERFSFWKQRLRTQLALFDLVRIDHFRGFEAYWEIPASEPNAVHGRWVEAPGKALFEELRADMGPELPLVAEDLGVITPGVEALRDGYGLPGMKILQFAFSGGAGNPYLIFNHPPNSVVYTGTHDNDTSLGWYKSLNDQERSLVDDHLGHSRDPMPWPLIHHAMISPARLSVLPMQDILGLDSEHRMNMPGTNSAANWQWRFKWRQVPMDLAPRLRHLIGFTGRAP